MDEQLLASVHQLIAKGIDFGNAKQTREALAAFDQAIKESAGSVSMPMRLLAAQALYYKGVFLTDAGDPQGAEAFAEFRKQFGSPPGPEFHEVISAHYLDSGIRLLKAGRLDEGREILDVMLRYSGDCSEPAVRRRVASALYNKATAFRFAGDVDRAVTDFDEVVLRFADDPDVTVRDFVAKAIYNKGIALRDGGRATASIAAFEDFAKRFRDAPEPAIRERAASSLREKSRLFQKLERAPEAIKALDELLHSFGNATEPRLRQEVAEATHAKAMILGQSGEAQTALEILDDLMRRFAADDSDEIRNCLLHAECDRGFLLMRSGEFTAAIETLSHVLERFGSVPRPELKLMAASAWHNLAAAFAKAGSFKEALPALEQSLQLAAGSVESEAQALVARALNDKGTILNQLGEPVDAFNAFNEVIIRFSEAPEPPLREVVQAASENLLLTGRALVTALSQRARELDESGDTHTALAAYDQVLSICGYTADTTLQDHVTMAWYAKARGLARLGETTQSIAAFDEALRCIGDDGSDWSRKGIAMVLSEKASLLRDTGNPSEALVLYQQAVSTLGQELSAILRPTAALVWLNQGAALVKLGREHEAIVAFSQTIKLLAEENDPESQLVTAKALLNRSSALRQLEYPDQAVTSAQELIQRFGQSPDPEVQDLVGKAAGIVDHPESGIDILCDTTAAQDVRAVLRNVKGIHSVIEIVPDNVDLDESDQLQDRTPSGESAAHAKNDPFEQSLKVHLAKKYRNSVIRVITTLIVGLTLLLAGVVWFRASSYLWLALLLAGIAVCAIYSIWEFRFARAIRAYHDLHGKQLNEKTAEARQLHEQATRILSECRRDKRPFALFLRNFDLEAYELSLPSRILKDSLKERVRVNFNARGKVETRVADSLRGRIAIVGIANPVVQRSDYQHAIPKLELPFDGWREVLDGLVAEAALIVVDLEQLSAGVAFELATIRRHQKQNQTVIILSDPGRAPAANPLIVNFLGFYGEREERRKPVSRNHRELADFPRIANESELLFENLAESALFADLLSAAQDSNAASR